MRLAHRFLPLGALPAALAWASRTESEQAPDRRRVQAAVVLFRHGARSPVFHLPGGDAEQQYATLQAPPAGAAAVTVEGGKAYTRTSPPGSPGLLTEVGWAQGVALGHRLRSRYGPPGEVRVRSSDVSRTVLTANAVLTGLYGDHRAHEPTTIEVVLGSIFTIDPVCPPLTAMLTRGRAGHRAQDADNATARAAVEQSFGPAYHASRCTLLAVHDDCIARRFAGVPPTQAVDVSLCDLASREAAREVRAALVEGGGHSAQLSSGRLCGELSRHLQALAGDAAKSGAPAHAASSASDGPDSRTALVLLSGHDTMLLGLLNVLDPEGKRVRHGEWPPHASSLAVELLDDRSVCSEFHPGLLPPSSHTYEPPPQPSSPSSFLLHIRTSSPLSHGRPYTSTCTTVLGSSLGSSHLPESLCPPTACAHQKSGLSCAPWQL